MSGTTTRVRSATCGTTLDQSQDEPGKPCTMRTPCPSVCALPAVTKNTLYPLTLMYRPWSTQSSRGTSLVLCASAAPPTSAPASRTKGNLTRILVRFLNMTFSTQRDVVMMRGSGAFRRRLSAGLPLSAFVFLHCYSDISRGSKSVVKSSLKPPSRSTIALPIRSGTSIDGQ